MGKEPSQEDRPPSNDEIRQKITDLEALQRQYPEIDALPNDGGLPAEEYRIWQSLKVALPGMRMILENRTKK